MPEIRRQHAIADETVAHTNHHAGFTQAFGQIQNRRDDVLRSFLGANNFQQGHYIGRTEEMHPEHILRPRCHRRNGIYIEGGGVGGKDGAGLGEPVEIPENRLLHIHFLENRLDHQISRANRFDIYRSGDAGHPGRHIGIREATAFACGLVIRFDPGQAPV